MRTAPALAFAALIAACTQFPELEGSVTPEAEAASYPTLVPLGGMAARIEAGSIDTAKTEAALKARVAALQARARALRNASISGPTQRASE